MKKLNKHIIKTYLGPFILTFFIAVFVLLMQFLWLYVDDLVGKGLEWHILLELMFYASATFVPLALPLAILLSSLMTFGSMGEKYELVAMKAAGISLTKILKPLVGFTLFLSLSAFYFSNNVLPVANLKFRSILYDIKHQKLAFTIKPGVYNNDIEDIVIRVANKNRETNELFDVIIYDHSQHKGNTTVTFAKRGTMEMSADDSYLLFTLYNGYTYDEDLDRKQDKKKPFNRTSFKEQSRKFDLSGFKLTRTNEEFFKNNYMMLNLTQLKQAEDSLSHQISKTKARFRKDLRSQYFYYQSRLDSTGNFMPIAPDTFHNDILAQYNHSEKKQLLNEALMKARNIQSTILKYQLPTLDKKELLFRKHKTEWHRKFTLSFACLVLFFIGAPLGAIIRKGGLGLPLVISVFLFIIFHIISITGEKSAKAGAIAIPAGMWIASAILLPVGVFLTIKATTDSPLMDSEAYSKTIGKLINLIKKKKK